MEPAPSTSSGKRSSVDIPITSIKRTRQLVDHDEGFRTYSLASERGLTCQVGYTKTSFIRFRQNRMNYTGEKMDTIVDLDRGELEKMESHLHIVIQAITALHASKRPRPAKQHLMLLLSPDNSTRLRYIEVSIFKGNVVSSIRRFFWNEEGILSPTKNGVNLYLEDFTRLQRLVPLLKHDLNTADQHMGEDRGRDDETERWILEFQETQRSGAGAIDLIDSVWIRILESSLPMMLNRLSFSIDVCIEVPCFLDLLS